MDMQKRARELRDKLEVLATVAETAEYVIDDDARDLLHATAELVRALAAQPAEPDVPMFPIARVLSRDGKIVEAEWYAPSLPDDVWHDLYPAAPKSRADAQPAEPVAHIPLDALARLKKEGRVQVFAKEAPANRWGFEGTVPLYAAPPQASTNMGESGHLVRTVQPDAQPQVARPSTNKGGSDAGSSSGVTAVGAEGRAVLSQTGCIGLHQFRASEDSAASSSPSRPSTQAQDAAQPCWACRGVGSYGEPPKPCEHCRGAIPPSVERKILETYGQSQEDERAALRLWRQRAASSTRGT